MHHFHTDRHHPYFPQTPPRNFEHQSHNGRHAAPDYWSSNRSMLIALEPRPFGVLHQERECLAHHLNFVDEWATHLYRQLACYDERISHLEGKERNDARKEQQWLRKRICDSLEDQKAIMLRLGELHIEIQSRERWCAIRRERDESNIIGCSRWGWNQPANWPRFSQDHWAPEHYPGTTYYPPMQHWVSFPLPIGNQGGDSVANEYQGLPGEHGQYRQHTNTRGYQQHHHLHTAESRAVIARCLDARQLEDWGSTVWRQEDANYDVVSGSVHSASPLSRRRNSLPSLQFAWSRTSGIEESHQCLGYAVEE
ncbi:hypothetical protein SUNI508_04818 [Seiridium unicorne]|uniref:Uncharacterized protein n=1 Tax=Seiridium unicorne TaxID=138068 RepID=A0ABR2V6C6_9PEZI